MHTYGTFFNYVWVHDVCIVHDMYDTLFIN